MKRPSRPFLLLVTLTFFPAVYGCSGGDSRSPNPSEPESGETSKVNTRPEALNRANYLRLDQGIAESELRAIFGPPQEVHQESKDSRKYIWKSGQTKLDVVVENGKVVGSWYPGEHEERKNRAAAVEAARSIVDMLRKYALKNKNRFPQRLEDLDPAELARVGPDTMAILKRGDAIIPWGKSANRLVWGWWKDTPQYGGPWIRFDGKRFDMATPKEFVRLEAVVLTADTIPADIATESKPRPGQPATLASQEKQGIGAQGFFTAGMLARLLQTEPGSLDEVAKHLVRNYWDVEVLRALEKGEILVRWGRDPRKCVYAYPRGFPKGGDPAGWAIYKGQWASFEFEDEARKAFAE